MSNNSVALNAAAGAAFLSQVVPLVFEPPLRCIAYFDASTAHFVNALLLLLHAMQEPTMACGLRTDTAKTPRVCEPVDLVIYVTDERIEQVSVSANALKFGLVLHCNYDFGAVVIITQSDRVKVDPFYNWSRFLKSQFVGFGIVFNQSTPGQMEIGVWHDSRADLTYIIGQQMMQTDFLQQPMRFVGRTVLGIPQSVKLIKVVLFQEFPEAIAVRQNDKFMVCSFWFNLLRMIVNHIGRTRVGSLEMAVNLFNYPYDKSILTVQMPDTGLLFAENKELTTLNMDPGYD